MKDGKRKQAYWLLLCETMISGRWTTVAGGQYTFIWISLMKIDRVFFFCFFVVQVHRRATVLPN